MHLTLTFLDDWLCGTGAGTGTQLDLAVHRDDDGLPWIPRTTLRGLLREAVRQLTRFDADVPDDLTTTLFGSPPVPTATGRLDPVDDEYRYATSSGRLRVHHAHVHAAIRHAVREDPTLAAPLFRRRASTALDERGVPRDHTLRAIELAIPLTLYATIEGPDEPDWGPHVRRALPLIRCLGAQRSRGLGRVRVREATHA